MGLDSYPLTKNKPQATAKVAAAFKTEFGEKAHAILPTTASEGFSVLVDGKCHKFFGKLTATTLKPTPEPK